MDGVAWRADGNGPESLGKLTTRSFFAAGVADVGADGGAGVGAGAGC